MRSLAWILVVTAMLACRKEPEGSPAGSGTGGQPAGAGSPAAAAGGPPAAPSPAVDEARRLYATVCAVCHGPAGRGDGAAAANLNPRPRDYTDPAWQASVGDAEIRKTILEGGIAVGKSPIMPAQPQLADQPDVLDALVALVRSFARK